MLYIAFIFIALLSLSQSQKSNELIQRSTLLTSRFNSIVIDGIFEVSLEPIESSSTASIDMETTSEGHEKVVVETLGNGLLRLVVNGSLTLPRSVRIHIRYNEPLQRLSISGVSSVITTKTPIHRSDQFLIEAHGTSRAVLQIFCDKLFASALDTSQIQVSGQASQQAVYLATGASSIDGWNLVTSQAMAEASGISTIYFRANDDAMITVSDISTVGYRLSNGRQASRFSAAALGNIVLL